MGSINWSGFDWQAFSTLATGLAAVIGATIVGVRQTMISKRQNEILERQTELEELKLKSELYDRRMEVFEAADEFLTAQFDTDPDPEKTERIQLRFQEAITKSKFLFRPSITETLKHALRQAVRLRGHKRVHAMKERQRDIAFDERVNTINRIEQLSDELAVISQNLPQIFGHELQLGAVDDPTEIVPFEA